MINLIEADEVFIQLRSVNASTLPFANNHASLPGSIRDDSMSISIRDGQRFGTITGNRFDDASLRRMVEQLTYITKLMPEVEGEPPFPDFTLVLEAPLFTESDEQIDSRQRLFWLTHLLDIVREADLRATGSITTTDSSLSVATSHGLFLHQAATLMEGELRVYSADGLQTAQGKQYRRSSNSFDPASLARRVVDTCIAWKNPMEVTPERTTSVFTATALADMLLHLLRQFSSEAVAEERSFLRRLDGSTFVGSKMFDERITLRSDPFEQELPSMPFTQDGVEVRPTTWVKNGVISAMSISRREAYRLRREPVAVPTNLLMDGGTDNLEELIQGTERALLVNGFAQLGVVDHSNCLLSGSTRDGLFLIENGRIVSAVKNLLLRETPLYLLKEVLSLGRPEETSPSGSYFPMKLPPIRVKDVLYTQASGVI